MEEKLRLPLPSDTVSVILYLGFHPDRSLVALGLRGRGMVRDLAVTVRSATTSSAPTDSEATEWLLADTWE